MWKWRGVMLLSAAICCAPAWPLEVIVKDHLGFEQIPRNAPRHVVGTWLLKETGCTRSIEEVGERYFMVSRCKAKKSSNTSLPIKKVSERQYAGLTTAWSYEISDDGMLILRSASGKELSAAPHAALWP